MRLPTVKPRQLIKIVEKLGFNKERQKGSHQFYLRESDGKTTVIPVHNQDLGRGLMRKILNDIDLSPDEFMKLLKKK